MTRSYSLAALTTLELTPPESISTAAAAGYDYVGLRLIAATPEERRHDVIGDTPMLRDMLARLADLDVSVLDVEVFRLRPETDVTAFEPVLDTAARLGARHLLVTGQDSDAARLVGNFAALCDMAAQRDLTVDLEFMPWTEVNSLTAALQVLQAADRPNAGVLLDPIHVDRCLTPLAELRAIPGRWLHYMQMCDAPADRPADLAGLLFQARRQRQVPGEGGLDLSGILASVAGDLPLSLEIASSDGVPALEQARRILAATRAWMGQMDMSQSGNTR